MNKYLLRTRGFSGDIQWEHPFSTDSDDMAKAYSRAALIADTMALSCRGEVDLFNLSTDRRVTSYRVKAVQFGETD